MDYFNNAVKPACSKCLSPVRASVIPSKRRSVCRETDGLYWWRKLLASLAGETDPGVERTHLDEIRQRRAAVRSGKASLVDGAEGLRKMRAAVRK